MLNMESLRTIDTTISYENVRPSFIFYLTAIRVE